MERLCGMSRPHPPVSIIRFTDTNAESGHEKVDETERLPQGYDTTRTARRSTHSKPLEPHKLVVSCPLHVTTRSSSTRGNIMRRSCLGCDLDGQTVSPRKIWRTGGWSCRLRRAARTTGVSGAATAGHRDALVMQSEESGIMYTA